MKRILAKVFSKAGVFCSLWVFIIINLMTSIGGCFTMFEEKDTISELSFSHDGKKVVFDRCQNDGCQIQVYNLETGELAAYQSPQNERWTMGKYSYDGKRIAFSVIPKKPLGGLELGEMQIAVMDADGKNLKKVTIGPGAKLYPAFSHNGKKIIYARAKRIRQQGQTPAAQYDVWEVNLETGVQEQLTFCEYYYMGYLSYFPDDERFIYYGEMPSSYKGEEASYLKDSAFKKKMDELIPQGKSIYGLVVMKGKELFPNPYHFPPKTSPHKPLLSKDGSVLIYEKSESGKFYLYSADGKHRLAVNAGPSVSVAISPDGKLIAVIPSSSTTLHTYTVSDGKGKHNFYLAYTLKIMKNYEDSIKKYERLHGEKFIMLPEKPSRLLNQ
jgi:dipeptidyl aminopeptidase/acylaminoacyl peptidase